MVSNKQLLDDFYDKGRINLEDPKHLKVPEPIVSGRVILLQ